MSFDNWTNRYSIGVATLDSYHQRLFSRFNISSDEFIKKASATDLRTLLDQLVDYGIYQIYAEELWMQNNQFPGFEKHRGVHDWISRRVLAIQEEVRDRNGPLTLEILSAMHNLLKCHILSSDGLITDFIGAR